MVGKSGVVRSAVTLQEWASHQSTRRALLLEQNHVARKCSWQPLTPFLRTPFLRTLSGHRKSRRRSPCGWLAMSRARQRGLSRSSVDPTQEHRASESESEGVVTRHRRGQHVRPCPHSVCWPWPLLAFGLCSCKNCSFLASTPFLSSVPAATPYEGLGPLESQAESQVGLVEDVWVARHHVVPGSAVGPVSAL